MSETLAAWLGILALAGWWIGDAWANRARAQARLRHPSARGFSASTERAIDEALALPGDVVVITRRIVHPIFGPCEQTWAEPHPIVEAERILRGDR